MFGAMVKFLSRRTGPQVAALLLACSLPQAAEAEASPSVSLLGMQKAPGYFRFQAQISQGKVPVGNGEFSAVYVRLRNGPGEPVAKERLAPVPIQDGVLNLEIGQTNAAAFEQQIANNPQLQVEICIENETNCMKPVSIASVPYAIKATYALNSRIAQNAVSAVECNYTHRAAAEDDSWTGADGTGIGYLDFASPIAAGASGTPTVAGLSINPTTNRAGFIQWTSAVASDAEELHLCGIENKARKPLDLLVVHARNAKFSGDVQVTGNAQVSGSFTAASGAFSVATSGVVTAPGANIGATGANINGPLRVGPADGTSRLSVSSTGAITSGVSGMRETTTFWGPVEFKGRVNIPSDSITANIGDNQITSRHIARKQINGEHIVDGIINGAHIADGQIHGGNDLMDSSLPGRKFGGRFLFKSSGSWEAFPAGATMCLLTSMESLASNGACQQVYSNGAWGYPVGWLNFANSANCVWFCL